MSGLVPRPHIKLNITNSNPLFPKNDVHPVAIKLNIRDSQSPPSRVKLRIIDPNTKISSDETDIRTNDSDLNLEQLSNTCELLPLPNVCSRIPGTWYMYNGSVILWDGKAMQCKHNRRHNTCPECGGNQICKHKKLQHRCLECGGNAICEHRRLRDTCPDCGGTQICEHKRRRSQCRDCKGGSICEHNRRRSQCQECGGSETCVHRRIQIQCRDCKGNQFCEHDRLRKQCPACNGSQICEHKQQRLQCRDCYVYPPNFCQICTYIRISKLSRTYPLCYRCHCLTHPDHPLPTKYKMKQHYIQDYVSAYCQSYDFIWDQTIQGGCSKRKPDMFLDCLTHSIIVEIDENMHQGPGYQCENKRIMEMFEDLGNRPLVVLRFNPDKYVNEQGQQIESLFSFDTNNVITITNITNLHQRILSLVNKIQYHVENLPSQELIIEKIFYNHE